MSRKGCERNSPFRKMRTIPFFCQMNIVPSEAHVTPTVVFGGRVVTNSDVNPGSSKTCAPDFSERPLRNATRSATRNSNLQKQSPTPDDIWCPEGVLRD